MKKFNFDNTQQFVELFSQKDREVTDAIVSAIEEAITHNKRTANLFEITFGEVDIAYEISLPASQWVQALQKCLDYYHQENEADSAIDTWKLLEAAKVL